MPSHITSLKMRFGECSRAQYFLFALQFLVNALLKTFERSPWFMRGLLTSRFTEPSCSADEVA